MLLANDCLACDVPAGKIQAPGGMIYEDEYWMVDHSVSPVMLRGFLIIKPKRHCEPLSELTLQEWVTFGPITHNVSKALTQAVSPARVYLCSFGESVTHVHFYLIPRTPDMPANGLLVLQQMFRDKSWLCNDEEAAEVAEQVRQEL